MKKYILLAIVLIVLAVLCLLFCFFTTANTNLGTNEFRQSFNKIFPDKFILEAFYSSDYDIKELPFIVKLKCSRNNKEKNITGFPDRVEGYIVRRKGSDNCKISIKVYFDNNIPVYIKILYGISSEEFADETQDLLYCKFKGIKISTEKFLAREDSDLIERQAFTNQ
jgi:hypothetical protein